MVRFFNKNLKAHSYSGDENIEDLIDSSLLFQLTELLAFHTRHFGECYNSKSAHLFQKLTIQLGITKPNDFWTKHSGTKKRMKDLFLSIELILESFHKLREAGTQEFFDDFIEDINDFFLINKIPLQVRYIEKNKEYYIEKIISEEISKKIGETLENFSEEEKVFEDFKDAIKKYSSGDYEGSIEKCCVSIEDYLCLLLDKQSCSSIDQFYKKVSNKLEIPKDLDDRFVKIISYIHKHRSPQNHGSIEKKEIEDEELVTEVIIGFTMTILNYLKKKNHNKT